MSETDTLKSLAGQPHENSRAIISARVWTCMVGQATEAEENIEISGLQNETIVEKSNRRNGKVKKLGDIIF